MRALILVLFVLVVLVLLYAAERRRARLTKGRWVLCEYNDGQRLVVAAVRAGQPRVELGWSKWSDPEFDYEIERVRAEARRRITAANSGNPLALEVK
jgi:hypothetical protein